MAVRQSALLPLLVTALLLMTSEQCSLAPSPAPPSELWAVNFTNPTPNQWHAQIADAKCYLSQYNSSVLWIPTPAPGIEYVRSCSKCTVLPLPEVTDSFLLTACLPYRPPSPC